jgi:hypothetical protein
LEDFSLFSNLREASGSQNGFNTRALTRNKSGLKGVSWCPREQKRRAAITANGVYYSLGYFNTPEEAHAAWRQSAQKLHGEFAYTG